MWFSIDLQLEDSWSLNSAMECDSCGKCFEFSKRYLNGMEMRNFVGISLTNFNEQSWRQHQTTTMDEMYIIQGVYSVNN